MLHTWDNQTAPKGFKRSSLVIITFSTYSRAPWISLLNGLCFLSLGNVFETITYFPSLVSFSVYYQRVSGGNLPKTTKIIFYEETPCFWRELFLVLCLHFGFFVYFIFTILFLLFFIWGLVEFYRFGVKYWIHLHGRGASRASRNHSAPRIENLVQFQNLKGIQRELTEARRLWCYWYSDGQENAYKLWMRTCVVLLLVWITRRTLKLETVCSPQISAKLYPIIQHLTPPPSEFKIQIFVKYSITAIFWVTNH